MVAIIAGDVYVYLMFNHDPSLYLSLVDSKSNLPTGLLTALFAPDPSVLLGTQTFLDWYVGFAGALFVWLAAFACINAGKTMEEFGMNSVLFGAMLIVISVGANGLTLLEGLSSSGPSTATYAAMGMVLGFGLLATRDWFGLGRPKLNTVSRGKGLSILSGLTFAVVFIALPLIEPAFFFDVNPVLKADWGAHVFSYLAGAAIPLILHAKSRPEPKLQDLHLSS